MGRGREYRVAPPPAIPPGCPATRPLGGNPPNPWIPSAGQGLEHSALGPVTSTGPFPPRYHRIFLVALAGILGFPAPRRRRGCRRPPPGIRHLPRPLSICEGSREGSDHGPPSLHLFWERPSPRHREGEVLALPPLPGDSDTERGGDTGGPWLPFPSFHLP